MKVLIAYFSGTGNTRRVVNKYAEQFKADGDEVLLHKIEDDLKVDLNDFDLIGIGYPVHAFNAPSIVVDFVKKLPRLTETKRAFIINTSGEPLKLNNISSIKTRKLLKKRNIIVTNEYHYCMPYNIIFRHTDDMAYRMWQDAQGVIPLDYKQLKANEKHRLGYFFMGRPLAWMFRVEHWGGRFNGKKYKVNNNCVNCQMCVKICPTKNISIDENGNFKFGKNCLMCMRCAHLCQKNAIKIGWFDKWKVNGAYNFLKPETEEENKHKGYCKKAYKRYFADLEKRIAEAEAVDKKVD